MPSFTTKQKQQSQALYAEVRQKIVDAIATGLLVESDFDFVFRDHVSNILKAERMENSHDNPSVRLYFFVVTCARVCVCEAPYSAPSKTANDEILGTWVPGPKTKISRHSRFWKVLNKAPHVCERERERRDIPNCTFRYVYNISHNVLQVCAVMICLLIYVLTRSIASTNAGPVDPTTGSR